MKHLKTYKIFESNYHGDGGINDELKYIALDITDDGFNVGVSVTNWNVVDRIKSAASNISIPNKINVFIDKRSIRYDDNRFSEYNEFYLYEVSPCIQQMIDYMESEGYNYEIYVKISDRRSYLDWKENADINKSSLVGYIDMTFTKKQL